MAMTSRPKLWPSPHWMPKSQDFHELPTERVASAERWSGLGRGSAALGRASGPARAPDAGDSRDLPGQNVDQSQREPYPAQRER